MLWDVIFEFYVKYIFGGNLFVNGTTARYRGIIGAFASDNSYVGLDTSSIQVFTYESYSGVTYYASLGNYLSLIATIISMVVILVLACLLIKKIYNICAHVIG